MGVQNQVGDNQYHQALNNQQHRMGGGQNPLGGIYLGSQQFVPGGQVGGFQQALVSGHQISMSREAGQSGMDAGNYGAQEDSLNNTSNNTSNSSSINRGWTGPQRMGGR